MAKEAEVTEKEEAAEKAEVIQVIGAVDDPVNGEKRIRSFEKNLVELGYTKPNNLV